MRDAIRYALVLSAVVHVLLQALAALEARRFNGRYAGLIRVPGDPRLVGSPSLTGCYLAIVLPLAPWPLWPVFALGLWWAFSWLSFVALAGAYGLTWAVR